MSRHFIDLSELSYEDIRAILDDAHARKAARKGWPQGRIDADAPAKDHVLSMIFQKNSTRTRFSFDAAMRQLGGSVIISSSTDMQLGRGEPIEDTAKVLSRMVDLVMIRANRHSDVEAFARASSVPVINGLTDFSHPCQILADLMTLEECFGDLKGRTLAWIGDGNNVLTSFIHAAPKLGFRLNIATPKEFAPKDAALVYAQMKGADISLGNDPKLAALGASAIITDTWVSMGDEDYEERMGTFWPFQVDQALMDLALPEAVFLHCLPAHRDEEVTKDVIDGPRSLVWQEAENRLHAQKSVIAWCLAAI